MPKIKINLSKLPERAEYNVIAVLKENIQLEKFEPMILLITETKHGKILLLENVEIPVKQKAIRAIVGSLLCAAIG